MKTLNKQLWNRALDSAVPETYTTLSSEQFGKALDEYTELVVIECVESLWTDECYNSDLALEEFEKNSKKILERFGIEND